MSRSVVSSKSTNVRMWPERLVSRVFPVLERVAPSLAGWWADRLFFAPPRTGLSPRLHAHLAAARRFEVPFGTGTLPAWRWGGGPTALLVHGWGSRGGHLAGLVPALVEAGFSAVAFDAPAHGDAPGRRTSIPEIAGAVQAVAMAAGPVHGIVAHSAGAAAAALALHRGLAAERAVFLAPAGNPGAFTSTFAARLGLGPGSLRAMRRRAERRIGMRFEDLDLRALVPEQRVPLLVVHDREDEEIGWNDGAAVAEAWPGAELMITRGLGHHRVLKDGAVATRAAAFLGGGPGGRRGDHGGCACRDGFEEPCPACALDRELFDRQVRWDRAQGVRIAASTARSHA